MKNFKMKQVQLPKTADIKIKIRLYILQLQQGVKNIRFIQVASPIFIFGFMALGVFYTLERESTVWKDTQLVNIISDRQVSWKKSLNLKTLKQVRWDKYRAIAKKRVYTQKAQKYKQYAYVRGSQLRGK